MKNIYKIASAILTSSISGIKTHEKILEYKENRRWEDVYNRRTLELESLRSPKITNETKTSGFVVYNR